MPRFCLDLTRSTNLAIAILCEILGISKTEFLRIAAIEYAVQKLKQKNLSDEDRQYISSLLQLAIEESALSSDFKQKILEAIRQ